MKIDETKKSIDEIEEVQKFNPFHDSLGKFASSNGFKTYSANPKTKAGQLAIIRSHVHGHGYTMNVHRESKGENILQNYNWLNTGKKPRVPAAQSSRMIAAANRGARTTDLVRPTPAKPAKPAASSTQAAKPTSKPSTPKQTPQRQTSQQNSQQTPKPQPSQQTTQQTAQQNQPAKRQTLQQSLAGVKLDPAHQRALEARSGSGRVVKTKQVANDHDQERVAGKDISKTFDIRKMNTRKDPIDAIAEAQGWNKGPTVTNDRELFDKAAIRAGRVMMRTVHRDQEGNSSNSVCKSTMTDGNYALGGSGGKALGTGMYVVDTSLRHQPRWMAQNVQEGQVHSFTYGDKQMMMTVHPNARIADRATADKLAQQFYKLSPQQAARFGYDRNTYIASKGYDGIKWHPDTDTAAYTTIFNKSALIFYGGVAK